MSGIFTSVATALLLYSGGLVDMGRPCDDFATSRSDCPGCGFLWIDAIPGDGLGHDGGLHLALIRERFEGRHCDPASVNLEEVAQALAIVRAAEPIRAEHPVTARHERPDLVSKQAHVIS